MAGETKFEPVSIEEGKPAKKSNRKVLVLAIVVILLLLLIVVVALVLFMTVAAPRDGAQIAVLDGGWTEWKPWSECSASCGRGTQKRLRACADPAPINGGRECGGIAEEARSCADWSCPDCSKQCPPNGRLSNCTICLCDGITIRGGVVKAASALPVAGVKIYETSQEWAPLAVTDVYGVFSIFDLCVEGSVFKLKKDGYMSERETYQASGQSLPQVRMIPTGKPVITKHPLDAAALVGGEVTLNCYASGVPDPTQYEWFKDGYVLETDGCNDKMCSRLQLKGVNKDDSGSYKCRATSTAGKSFSDHATIVIRESEDSFCDTKPKPKLLTLPATCSAVDNGAQVRKVNVGTCLSSPCATRQGTETEQLCCGPVEHEDIEIKCQGFNYSLRKVSSCGCTTCVDDQTKEVTIDGQVRLAMKTPSGSYISGPLPPHYSVEYTYVHATDGPSTAHADHGEFHVLASSVNGRVIIQFMSAPNLDYLPQATVIEIPKGIDKIFHVVTLVPKSVGQTVNVNPREGTSVTYGEDDKRTSAGTLVIPPGRLAPKDGGLAIQSVPFSLSFADPREQSSLDLLAPGMFTYEDEEGEVRHLQTFGVLGFNSDDHLINGEVELKVDTDALGIANDEDGQPDAWIWLFDSQSGDWKRSNRLTRNNGDLRIKRQKDSSDIAVARTEIPYPLSYLNIDKPLFRDRECKVVVVVHESVSQSFKDDDSFLPFEEDALALEGESVVAYTRDPSSGTYLGVTRGTTDKDGKTCLSIPCGYQHELKVQSPFGSANASASHYLPTAYTFVNMPLPGSDANGNDVIYDTVRFSSPVPDNSFLNEGPVYRIRSYGSECPAELPLKYHFKFEAPSPEAAGVLNAVELRPHRKLSWNQLHATEIRRACMVRVRLQTLDAAQTKVVGVSKFADQDGDAFGAYTAGMSAIYEGEMRRYLRNEYAACVQVKCPEDIRDTDEGKEYGITPTYVQLNIAHPNVSRCKLTWAVNIWTQGNTPPLVIDKETNSSVNLLINAVGDTIFEYERQYLVVGEGYGNGGYRRALRSCLKSSWKDLALYDCADGKVEMNWWNMPRDERPQK